MPQQRSNSFVIIFSVAPSAEWISSDDTHGLRVEVGDLEGIQ